MVPDASEEVYFEGSRNNDLVGEIISEMPFEIDEKESEVPTEGILTHVKFNIKQDIEWRESLSSNDDVQEETEGGENLQTEQSRIEVGDPGKLAKLDHIVNPLVDDKGQRRCLQPNFGGTIVLESSDFGIQSSHQH